MPEQHGFNVAMRQFAKPSNSTLVPAQFTSLYQCVIKQGMDILSPVLGIALSLVENPTANNYAHIPVFGRYYFIKNWEFRDGLWWAYLKVDTLATYKVQIGRLYTYVLRSASAYDPLIPDTKYSHISTALVDTYTIGNMWTADTLTGGTYILGILSKDGNAGAVAYYNVDALYMRRLRNAMLSDTGYISQIQDISTNLAKSLINPFQYLVSATWFPFLIEYTNEEDINFGWWTATGVKGCQIGSLTRTFTRTFNIVANATAVSQGGGYLYSQPYSRYILSYPPFGEIELDSSAISKAMSTYGSTIQARLSVIIDLVTGKAYAEVTTQTSEDEIASRIGYAESAVGVPTQLGQITQDIAGAVSSTANLLVPAPTLSIAGQIADAISDAKGIITSIMPRATTRGSNGSASVYHLPKILTVSYYPRVENSISEFGRPLCAGRTINTLSGFIKTLNVEVAIGEATLSEIQEIKDYMDGGFFYE